MNSSVIGSNEPEAGEVQLPSGQSVSMQTVQQIYHEFTGQKEELSKLYTLNHKVSFEDLSDLDRKMGQLCEQYNIVSENSAVTVYFVDDQKSTFSSFERFALFDKSTTSCVERIRVTYNFLIILPNLQSPQSYKVEVEVSSRAAMAKRARQNTEEMGMFFRYFMPATGSFEVEYVDYMVARNIQNTVDGWFQALQRVKVGRLSRIVKKHSDEASFLFKVFSSIVYLSLCFYIFTKPDYWAT